MGTEGLPLSRWERGNHQDIIAGADFLSILMDSPAERQAYKDLTTQTRPSVYRFNDNRIRNTRFVRRSTVIAEPIAYTENPSQALQSTKSTNMSNSENSKSNGSLVISVQVSSSEGDSRINKVSHEVKTSSSTTQLYIPSSTQLQTTASTPIIMDQIAVSSEEHPSLIAQVNKDSFSVDEKDPITSNRGESLDYINEFPANVLPITNLPISQTPGTIQPFQHQSVVYHDNPNEAMRGRSVSYSAVIQTLPNQPVLENFSQGIQNERRDRHYEIKDVPKQNNFDYVEKHQNDSLGRGGSKQEVGEFYYVPTSAAAESTNYFATSKYTPSIYPTTATTLGKKTTIWHDDSKLNTEHTEKNWEVSEKHYGAPEVTYSTITKNPNHQFVPVVYGKPEQNYEIDETVSVMSNGRAHGVQSTNAIQLSTPINQVNVSELNHKPNDSQKVGYVVEGRNYRKYRVEERTSDGFIVGEYGVVSHDDGTLRGVRYTADSTINPRVIYDALMKFLSL